MTQRTLRPSAFNHLAFLGLRGLLFSAAVALAGCGGSGSSLFNNDGVTTGNGDSGGSTSTKFAIVSCSLGGVPCGGASNVVQQSTQLVFTFNAPVMESSVTQQTLSIVQVDSSGGGGSELAGARKVSGNKVTFVPEVSFDSSGNVTYGFAPNKTYRIRIPNKGQAITSVEGRKNTAAVDTNVIVSNDLADVKPGAPHATLITPGPADINNADVNTPIDIEFDDIMDASTLVNKIQGTSQTLSVKVDLDGVTDTPTDLLDEIAVTGTWDISFDALNAKTTVSFTHPTPFPGPGPVGSRRIVVLINTAVVKDLGGNNLASGSVLKFKTSGSSGSPFTITETFNDNSGEDTKKTGANMWNSAGSPGALVPGLGGGSGIHGEFVAFDEIDFSTGTSIATDGIVSVSPKRTPLVISAKESLSGQNVTITDGIYQFSSFDVGDGITNRTIRFEGSNIPRIFVRGQAKVATGSVLDVSGIDGSPQSPTPTDKANFAGLNTPCKTNAGVGDPGVAWSGYPQYSFGKAAARGGPIGGDSGKGGDMPLNTPGYVGPPSQFVSFHGSNGFNAGGPTDANNKPATGGSGSRGVPTIKSTQAGNPDVFGSTIFLGQGLGVSFDTNGDTLCTGMVGVFQNGVSGTLGATIQIGSGGGGGGSHFEDGRTGAWCQEPTGVVTASCNSGAGVIVPPSFATKLAPPNPPELAGVPPNGQARYPLEPPGGGGLKGIINGSQPNFGSDGVGNFALLRGGAGGGGSGTNMFGTSGTMTTGTSPAWSGTTEPTNVAPIMSIGAAGGGGAGVLQLQAGRSVDVQGTLDASGGDGGDHIDHPTFTQQPFCFTTGSSFFGQGMSPGGGGGGGAIVIQSGGTITGANGAYSVRGGFGGDGKPLKASAAISPLLLGGGGNAVRLRGGDGGNGRAFFQPTSGTPTSALVNPAAGFILGSAFTGINSNISNASDPLRVTDFSGAESKFYKIDLPTSFNTLQGYRLTINTTGGQQTLIQDDLTHNDVQNGTTGTFSLGGPLPFQIYWQGSRANVFGNEDPTTRTVWTTKITNLSIASPKFVRAVIVFNRPATLANASFISIDQLAIDAFGG